MRLFGYSITYLTLLFVALAADTLVRPPLIESLAHIGYDGYLEVVVYGRKNVSTSQQSVMPAFGEAIDVMENIDDIYSYLKARADGAVGRGRPERRRSSGAGVTCSGSRGWPPSCALWR